MIDFSNAIDLAQVLEWLRREYEETGQGFYVNRGIIERAHGSGDLLVLREGGHPVAFAVADEQSYDILVVKPDKRGRGFGRELVQACVEQSRLHNVCVIQITCTPATSIPFWEKMGFKLLIDTPETRVLGGDAYLVLDRKFSLPGEFIKEVSVVVEFYPEQAAYEDNVPCLAQHRPRAFRTEPGTIEFDHRIIGFDFSPKDLVVRILLDGNQLYFGKAKYDEAEALGVVRSGIAFYLDGLAA